MKQAGPQKARALPWCKGGGGFIASFCGRLLSSLVRSAVSWTLCIALCAPEISTAQQAPMPTGAQKYKLTVDEDASRRKRVKNGRVSSQAVVRVTDENDAPVPAIAVIFLIPQGSGGAFASGGLTSIATTNAEGIASSGPYSAPVPKGNSFITARVRTPNGDIAIDIPIPDGGGLPPVVKAGIIAGAAAATAAVLYIVLHRSPPQGGGSTIVLQPTTSTVGAPPQ